MQQLIQLLLVKAPRGSSPELKVLLKIGTGLTF